MEQHAVDHLALALGHVADDRVRDGVVLGGLRGLGDGELRVVAPDLEVSKTDILVLVCAGVSGSGGLRRPRRRRGGAVLRSAGRARRRARRFSIRASRAVRPSGRLAARKVAANRWRAHF